MAVQALWQGGGKVTVDFAAMRAAMVDSQLRTSEVNDPRIFAAMGKVERERFVPAERAATCYIDRPVSLGDGRALNPPLVAGRLLMATDPQPGEKVMLIGAATGYLAAVLAEMGVNAVTVEGDKARAGAPKSGPFDVIIIDGAIEDLPKALTDQLADGGRIALGTVDHGVTRLEAGRKAGGVVGLNRLAEMEMTVLPGFEKAKSFQF